MQGGLSLHVEQAEPAWRYAVETEFADLSPDPKPIETTTLIYDSNNRQLPFERSPTQSSIHRAFSEDERWFALAVGEDIDLYDLTNNERTILRGHTVEINYVAFAPGRSDTLISSARCWEQVRSWRETRKLERPEIFVWDIKGIMTRNTTQSGTNVAPESMDDLIGRVRTVQPKEDPPTASELSEQDRLAQTLDTLFSRLANRYSARQIRGRLCSSLQSSLFNHAGTILVFLPGTSPLSNGDHRWDFALHNLETLQVVTLTGHRDWIGWTCFTPDDKLVISASSDRTFRVWDPETGECVRTWNVDSGACSGLVSPDSQRFLGTDMRGIIRVWHLGTGDLMWSYEDHSHRGGRRSLVDWSADGRYIIAGSASFGRILIFDTHRAVVDGTLYPIQSRVLSTERTVLPPHLKPVIGEYLGIYSLRFIPTTDGEVMFGSTISLDLGIEIVSLTRGKRWRIIPFPEPQEGETRGEIPRSRPNGPAMHPAWTMLGKMGMLAVVSRSRVGFWKLD